MATARAMLGEAPCLCCGKPTPVKEQANGLAIMTCNWCDVKVQSFSKISDAKMRARIIGGAPVKPASPSPAPAAAPAPAAEPARRGGLIL
ncbi:hypothetical protein HNQ50_001395 [Silvimonas terrae]|uniref:Uncharacterized protein n=1 Tax=Silvimonas terrae TaxID=300266 RepID=A0A840RE91_9NEIS|nr:hypothetical protein [Silvimonas terrae]MBB5190673.1 hypothetical protein [Silvimonas terrae]